MENNCFERLANFGIPDVFLKELWTYKAGYLICRGIFHLTLCGILVQRFFFKLFYYFFTVQGSSLTDFW